MGARTGTRIIALALVASVLLGCDMNLIFAGDEKTADDVRKEQEARDLAEKENQAKAQQLAQGIERTEGNYKLTFTGKPPGPWAGSFDPVNRTPAMLTDTTFTAKEIQKFTSGSDPRTQTQVKDTWVIDATRSGSKISGTAKFVRWRGEQDTVIIVDQQTGQERVVTGDPAYYQPELTVTWDGVVKAVVADDGTIAGTVTGTFSNSEGFSEPFSWEFTGDPTK